MTNILISHALTHATSENRNTMTNILVSHVLSQILKPFCDNDKKYNRAIEHLLEIGLLSRATLRSYGGPNMLWGRYVISA